MSHFWTALSSTKWMDLDKKKFQLGQNFTTNPCVLSDWRFGLAFWLKSIKGDFLLKMELSDLVKVIFGHSKGSLTICSIPVLGSKFLVIGHLRRGVYHYTLFSVYNTWIFIIIWQSVRKRNSTNNSLGRFIVLKWTVLLFSK